VQNGDTMSLDNRGIFWLINKDDLGHNSRLKLLFH